MAVDRTFKDQADLQGLQGDAIVDLMIIDLAPVSDEITPDTRYLRFVNWVVTDGQKVSYGGLTYEPVPFKAAGFSLQTDGVPPNPVLTVSNIGLEFTALVNSWDDMIGAKLTRRRVLARHLDSGSAPDANAHWPDEVWTIQQKETENKLLVSFRLSTAFDLDGITLPRRRALRYTCPWTYREEGCDYAGPPVADARDQPLTTTGADPLTAAVINTRNAILLARSEYQTAATDYAADRTASDNGSSTVAYWAAEVAKESPWTVLVDELFQRPYYMVLNGMAYWNGGQVTLGNEYRIGRMITNGLYAIQRWAQDTAVLSRAQANLGAANAAQTVLDADTAAKLTVMTAKQAAYSDAVTLYRNAVAAWQASASTPAAIRASGDVCGKRLASCRLRFYDPVTDAYDSLPFGGFPGLTT